MRVAARVLRLTLEPSAQVALFLACRFRHPLGSRARRRVGLPAA